MSDYEITVEWQPFVLHPEIPPEGMPIPVTLRDRLAASAKYMRQMAAQAGLPFRQELAWIPSSRRALEAAEYARRCGKHEAFHRTVFRRLFADGEDIGRWEVLKAAAEEVGLDPIEMQTSTERGEFRGIVDAQATLARQLGISAVPAFIFNDRYALVGAQPYEAFQQVMERLAGQQINAENVR